MKKFDIYVRIIFIVKIIFIFLAIYRLYIKAKHPKDKQLELVEKWKGRFEFMFISLMSILLIYIFNPRSSHIGLIDGETKLLLYLFGFVLLLTENWSVFIHESLWFKKFQAILR
jgi:hypothetical protein